MSTFFGEFAALRDRPMPDLAPLRARRGGYREHALDLESAVSGEPLVDLAALGIGGENYYHRLDAPPYYGRAPGSIPGLFLRRGVAERLARIDARLRGEGLALHVYDGYRPLEVQAWFHDVWMPAFVRAAKPHLTPPEIQLEVEAYWAAPTRSESSPAPHQTGGAVDLTLVLARNGEPLPMGTIFDDMSTAAALDHYESPGRVITTTDREARGNRRLLYWLMDAEGFAANPNEWWHFSWGDQLWARLKDEPAALYGLAEFPPGA